ncbi:MAG: WYL domain-containing protein [Planctomycetota bacterium]
MANERINRLLRLIMLLQARRPRTAQELADELGVSKRTVYRDLNTLEDAGVPCRQVDPDGRRGLANGSGYRIDKGFHLPPTSLSVAEVLGLLQLAKATGAQRDRPLHAAALSGIYKLISTVPDPVRGVCSEMMANVSVNPGAMIEGDAESRHYTTLQTCIERQRRCRVTYQPPIETEPMVMELDPYALHHANRAWYVLGRTDLHEEVRVLKVMRIVDLQPTDQVFARPGSFSVARKLGNAWQLIPEGRLHKVELEFTRKVATNVSEVKWHLSQEHEILEDGRCVMRFEVDGLNEIAWWVCGYADQVVVRKPKKLAELVRAKHEQAAKRYADG